MNNIIVAKDLSYRYQDERAEDAVKSVSFSIRQGEFVAILGHNGSGKSTLAKLLNALYAPSGGTLTVAGIELDANQRPDGEEAVWNIRRQCGMVFQNPDNQLVATVVEEDVAFGLENLGVPPAKIRLRVDEALEMTGISEYAQCAPHMLSGGQKQRVAIAGVLAMRPEIIVFDEATAMLDPSGREEVMRVVKRLNREEGLTIVWITHFMEEAAQADRLLVMSEGEIRLEGSPREVFGQAEAVRALGLDVPEMVTLGDRLRADGLPVPEGILTVEEMAVSLCQLKSKT